ncbi:alpha/beta hydrolase [Roseovarius sp. 2305UL8-3]|uniref:alpha/beta hydrolase n=1 Tax=Roseovarius conchicola TaxID=3121636 RepID=UPI003526DEF8
MSASRLYHCYVPRLSKVACLMLVLALSACAPRQAAKLAPPSPLASTERIYVTTELALDNLGPIFGENRPKGQNYMHVDVSIPPTHKPGKISWPKGPPDAATDFVVTDLQVYRNAPAMIGSMRRDMPGEETLVYVHGYNSTFSESVYRFAQIRADFGGSEPGMLYSWPSAGDPRGYAYDRDSVLTARDDFEATLNALTQGSNKTVVLLAHSMGAHLVMETLRQAALSGNRRLLNRINAVVLMSPDIDPDVFRSQAEAIGTLPDPFLIFISKQDRALSLAGLLTGRKPRLGVIDSTDAVAGLDVKVIDFTALGDGEELNHNVPFTSPAAISVLKGMIAQTQAGETPFRDYTVLTAKP